MPAMLKRLRLQLTLLYILAALTCIVLLNLGSYHLLTGYFQQTTDLAMQHKMAHEFRLLGAPLPEELLAADSDWLSNRSLLLPAAPRSPVPASSPPHGDRDNRASEEIAEDYSESFYDGELAAIFVLPLNAAGNLVFDPNPYTPPLQPDAEAAAAALEQGHDWRTIRLENGTSVRLLTYRLTRSDGPAVLQLGRTLIDQERVLGQLLGILLGIGGGIMLVLGVVSWWLAGRSLLPAQQAWERQQTFVANASHELRTPLALIRASAEAALRRLPADLMRPQQLIGDIVQECDHLTRLLHDLLLLSRLDARRLHLERVAIALPDLLDDLQHQTAHLASSRQVAVQVGKTDGMAWGDPTRLRQVLLILLDNALQYTPPGGSIEMAAQPASQQIQISVRDTGCGIAPEHLPHIFERFYRVESSHNTSNGTSSSGLGLAIARMLIEAQQGTMHITSQVQQGTCVTVTLPAAPKASHAAG